MPDSMLSTLLQSQSASSSAVARSATSRNATEPDPAERSFSGVMQERAARERQPARSTEPERRGDAPDRARERDAAQRSSAERRTAAERSEPARETEPARGQDKPAADDSADASAADSPADDVAETAEAAGAEPPDGSLPAAIAALIPALAGTPNTADKVAEAPEDTALLDRLLKPAARRGEAKASGLAADAPADAAEPAQKDNAAASFAASLAASQKDGTAGRFGAAMRTVAAATAQDALPPGATTPGFQVQAQSRSEQASLPQLPVHTPAGQRGWSEDIGSRMLWMVGRNESKAELVLTPPHLGKVEVSITIGGDQASAQFVAASQAARDALEQSMPRLRELLQQAGVNLGETNVSTSGQQQSGHEAASSRAAQRSGRDGGTDDAVPLAKAPATWTRGGNGMIDIFA